MKFWFFVPTPLEGGTIYSNGFFVQSILADRYIHRREVRLVSLESLSSVEYGTKKIFLIFVFFTGRYRGLNFRTKFFRKMLTILFLKTKYIVG